MNYSIGLDIGIASIGFSVLLLNDNDEPSRILKMGARIFDEAENHKDGSSLAKPRREKRGMRRRLRRKAFRKERIKELISQSIMSREEILMLYSVEFQKYDIYKIRYEALDRLLSKEEFVKLLIHLSQRRGFKSNRKVDAKDAKSESGRLLTAVNENSEIMQRKHYRTIGEMLYKDEKFSMNKRNKSDDYSNTFSRADYEKEIRLIFQIQRSFGNQYATENFENKYLEIYLSQRSFDDGPGGNSPYGGNQIEKMLGKCTFETNEFRAVKASFSFEYFTLLSKINTIRVGTAKRFLTKAEKDEIIRLAFKTKSVNYLSIRKAIKLDDGELFNISYSDIPPAETEKKTKFEYLKAYHTFKKAYGDSFDLWSSEKKNTLAYALTVYKNDSRITEYLSDFDFSTSEIEIALTLPSFSKTGHLSVKAIDKIIPYLEKGLLYNEACEKAGYNFKADDTSRSMYLPANPMVVPELQDLANPVVRRAISQTIKVVNSIIREYGESPTFVNIELARELSKNFNERTKLTNEQNKNKANNEKIMERLKKEFHIIQPTGMDLVKLKLWEEQDGICPYSGKPILIEHLFDIGYVDVDHIIPYSVSFDDSYSNKILVFANENRQKGNRVPMQYLKGDARDRFEIWVGSSHLSYRKRKNLLKVRISDEDLSGFKTRNLQDTQYISRFLLNYLKKYLQLQPNNTGRKNTIVAVNGAATSYVRKRWGINKIRENGDTHHAVDAVVIACITQGMIRRISEYSKYHETEYINPETGEILDLNRRTGELINKFPLPYPTFRKELEILCSNDPARMLKACPLPNYGAEEELKPIFVSRMPRHKNTGPAHQETNRKQYEEDDVKYTISKVPLGALKLKNGEIENYYNPSSDMLLYNALKERLARFGGKGENAFQEPFYKPRSDGSKGPIVKKVKIMNKSTISVPVLENTAVADNGSMIRVDVFRVEGESYYLVPIYVADTVKNVLPNRAITRDKPYSQWKVMDDMDFLFSLYPNDLIKVTSKKDISMSLVNKNSTLASKYTGKELFLYYKSTGISTASITVINHDNTYTVPSLGVKSLLSLEKYQVDVLGNITKVNKEKRMGFR